MALLNTATSSGEVAERLIARIMTREALIAVVGAGYVGLPLAVEQAKAGFQVVCVDKSAGRTAKINAGENYIDDVDGVRLAELVQAGRLRATTEQAVLAEADVVIICVPTPLTENKEPDISIIVDVASALEQYCRSGQLISLESTTYPGTTEEILLPALTSKGLQVGVDIFLSFSPERVDPGNPRFNTQNTPKVVGGVTPVCGHVASTMYQQSILHVVPVSSPRVAEMAKVFENTYRAVNIALVNEMAMLCDRMGIDAWEVIEAAATKPFGIQIFWPGPGVGGHCIPLDPMYLAWKARQFDFSTRFIDLANDVNTRMPYFVTEKVGRALGESGKPLNGSTVLVLGVAYKRDIADERESPALKVIQLLQREGAKVKYHDPYVPELHPHGWFKEQMRSEALTPELLRSVDAVVLATDHSSLDYDAIVRLAPLIIDTRNRLKDVRGPGARIVKL